jgi:hypothetical protein
MLPLVRENEAAPMYARYVAVIASAPAATMPSAI